MSEARAARAPATASWHADWAWLGGHDVVADVVLEVTDGVLTRVESGVPTSPPNATRLPGLTLPGLANAHSHAFHRALRGRTHAGATDFWGWRDRMYALAGRLDPDRYHRLARACFAEMALSGITLVGEFHYLHHPPGGARYDEPNAMGEALRAAAREAGLRLTLLDTLYLHAGIDEQPLDPAQQRFSDGDAERWAARVETLASAWAGDPTARVGTAIHSVRAVDPKAMQTVSACAGRLGAPLHVHVSEQPAENEACRRAHGGSSPTALLADAGVLGPLTTAIHATHVTDDDLDLLAAHDTTVCLCPTTERDLADGIGPARAMAARSIPLALGTDSQAVVDLFEEARAAELDERLASGSRAGLRAETLLTAATAAGTRCLGWPEAGALAPGRLADFVTVGLDSVRLAGIPPADLVAGVVGAATASDVTDVVVGGRPVVRDGAHLLVPDVPGELAAAIASTEHEASDG